MKIVEITPANIHYVRTEGEEYNYYTRHSAQHWTVTMGESDEELYNCEEIEAEFQRVTNVQSP